MNKDFKGQIFGRLTVISDSTLKMQTNGKNRSWVFCKCQCGNIKEYGLMSLKCGDTKSCGCLPKDRLTIHGLTKTRLFGVWSSMKNRCTNQKAQQYKNYGGRGIKICDVWLRDFFSFYTWAMNNGYSKGLELDRRNNDGNYEPENCRFINQLSNARNKRTNHFYEYKGETKSMAEWVEILGLNYGLINNRIFQGWSFQKAVETPKRGAAA